MPKSDLEYWNRRSRAGTVADNLRWSWSHAWTHARAAVLGLIGIQLLLGLQPALLIHVTPEERRAGYVDRLLTGRGEQKEMRLFALHGPLTERWRSMRQVLRERLFEQRRRQVVGVLPGTGLRIAVGLGVAGVLASLLGSRVLTPGAFVALFQGVDDMFRAGGSLGYNSRELQGQSAEVGYVREFLDLAEEGRLVEDGTHDELVSRGGEYARLWALQAGWHGR